MNTIDTPISNPPPVGGMDAYETQMAVFIPAHLGLPTSVCMASPVRRCFSVALRRPVNTIPQTDGVTVYFLTQDREQDAQTVRQELEALGYAGIAHAAWLLGDGWKCFHGNVDDVNDFNQKEQRLMDQLPFMVQIQNAHTAAALQPPQ